MVSTTTPVAVDIGATKTVVAVGRGGTVEPIGRFATDPDPGGTVGAIATTLQSAGLPRGEVRIGVGCPGPLDPISGTIIEPPNLPGWWGFPLADALGERTGATVLVQNDANLGALGEARFGSGRDAPSLYYITLSTGIGAGYIVDGQIVGGYNGLAGEVWALDSATFVGAPRGETILELASGPGLVRSARRRIAAGRVSSLGAVATLDTAVLFAAADAGDVVALETVDAGRDAIAGLIIAVCYTVAPAAIVLAGGLCTESRWFVDPVRHRVAERLSIRSLSRVPIRRAELWDQAVLYGALHLASREAPPVIIP